VRQSKATKQSAKDFSHVAQLSKSLRSSLARVLPKNKNRENMYKMSAALRKWLRREKPIEEIISLERPEFNDKSLFSSKFRKDLLVDFGTKGKVMITVPRLKIPDDIVAPSHTISVRLDIAVAGSTIKDPQPTEAAFASINMPYKNGWIAAATTELGFNCRIGTINVVAVSLHYMIKEDGHETEIVDDRWTPVAIVAAVMV